jgi:hypothetical protein
MKISLPLATLTAFTLGVLMASLAMAASPKHFRESPDYGPPPPRFNLLADRGIVSLHVWNLACVGKDRRPLAANIFPDYSLDFEPNDASSIRAVCW